MHLTSREELHRLGMSKGKSKGHGKGKPWWWDEYSVYAGTGAICWDTAGVRDIANGERCTRRVETSKWVKTMHVWGVFRVVNECVLA